MKIIYPIFLLLLLIPIRICAKQRTFAIVIDPMSLAEAKVEVNAYAEAIERKQGLKVLIIVDRWGIPDSIRQHLYQLYCKKDALLIGAVLVGDIPIPMIRDAQFLTSAFKMDQKIGRRESSVPSDRYYDDFDLKFISLGKDVDQVHYPYYYYSLSADGKQILRPNIFSGRIRPTDTKQSSRYEKLRAYLRKATQFKLHPEPLSNIFIFQGSGSLSESNVAHLDEYRGWLEHLPILKVRHESFSYMQYDDEPYIKVKMMNELMRPDLSFAIMHHHGDFDTQYLGTYPHPKNASEAIEYIKYTYRDQIRTGQRYGKNPDSMKAEILRSSDIPASWLDNYRERTVIEADSMVNVKANLTLDDFEDGTYRPNCRMINFDACYNGSFNHSNSIANAYIFQPGNTLVALGGTVNVLQDKWPDRFMGLMGEGMMVGYLCQSTCYLEWHIIGDPTFCFAAELSNKVNELFYNGNKWSRMYHRQLKKTTDPDLFAMSIYKLQTSGVVKNETLLNLLEVSPYFAVRLESFFALKCRGGDDFVRAMQIASHDNHELIQRFAVNEIRASGDPRVLPSLTRLLCKNNTSVRVAFNVSQSLQFFPETEVQKVTQMQVDSFSNYNLVPLEYRNRIEQIIKKGGCNFWESKIANMLEGKMDHKHALRQANYMRIYTPSYLIPQICDFMKSCKDSELQHDLLEAMGWHGTAYTSNAIAEAAKYISEDSTLIEANRREALKTWKRVTGR